MIAANSVRARRGLWRGFPPPVQLPNGNILIRGHNTINLGFTSTRILGIGGVPGITLLGNEFIGLPAQEVGVNAYLFVLSGDDGSLVGHDENDPTNQLKDGILTVQAHGLTVMREVAISDDSQIYSTILVRGALNSLVKAANIDGVTISEDRNGSAIAICYDGETGRFVWSTYLSLDADPTVVPASFMKLTSVLSLSDSILVSGTYPSRGGLRVGYANYEDLLDGQIFRGGKILNLAPLELLPQSIDKRACGFVMSLEPGNGRVQRKASSPELKMLCYKATAGTPIGRADKDSVEGLFELPNGNILVTGIATTTQEIGNWVAAGNTFGLNPTTVGPINLLSGEPTIIYSIVSPDLANVAGFSRISNATNHFFNDLDFGVGGFSYETISFNSGAVVAMQMRPDSFVVGGVRVSKAIRFDDPIGVMPTGAHVVFGINVNDASIRWAHSINGLAGNLRTQIQSVLSIFEAGDDNTLLIGDNNVPADPLQIDGATVLPAGNPAAFAATIITGSVDGDINITEITGSGSDGATLDDLSVSGSELFISGQYDTELFLNGASQVLPSSPSTFGGYLASLDFSGGVLDTFNMVSSDAIEGSTKHAFLANGQALSFGSGSTTLSIDSTGATSNVGITNGFIAGIRITGGLVLDENLILKQGLVLSDGTLIINIEDIFRYDTVNNTFIVGGNQSAPLNISALNASDGDPVRVVAVDAVGNTRMKGETTIDRIPPKGGIGMGLYR